MEFVVASYWNSLMLSLVLVSEDDDVETVIPVSCHQLHDDDWNNENEEEEDNDDDGEYHNDGGGGVIFHSPSSIMSVDSESLTSSS